MILLGTYGSSFINLENFLRLIDITLVIKSAKQMIHNHVCFLGIAQEILYQLV